MAVALSVVVVGVLLSSSAAATSDKEQVAGIFNKLEERVEATIDTYSEEEIVELERGISQCNMILKEVDSMSMSFFSPDEETKEALYLSSKQCMVHKMMEFLNLKNETLGLKVNEIEYLEEIKPILDKYSSENEDGNTTAQYNSTTNSSKNINENDVENTDHNIEKDSKTTEINSRYVDGNRENVTNVGDGNRENTTNSIQVNSNDSDGNINIDSSSTEISSTYSDGSMDTHNNGTEVNSTFTDVDMDSDNRPTEINSTYSDRVTENGIDGTKSTEATMENGIDVTISTEATMENGKDGTKSTEATMKNGIEGTKSTEATSADSDENIENGIDGTKSTEITSEYSDKNLDNGSESTEVNYNYSDENLENYTKYQNESSSRLLDIPAPIFLESLLSQILSGIFGVLILMMIFGTIIGCCFLFKYNCKPLNDDLVPLETTANDDVVLEFYSSQPETPVPENCPDQRMITTPLLVNQIDNLNPVSQLDPSHQHHLQPPQSSHLQPQ